MRRLASIALVAMGVFACSSTDTARPSSADAGNEGGGGTGSAVCEESVCEGHTYMGQSLGTCCVSARGCGVVLNGDCITTAALRKLDPDAGRPPSFGTAETVVLDPSCPDQTLMMGANIVLKGCCDKSGVCGSSTEAIRTATGFGIALMCITRTESARFGQPAPADAAPEKTCNYPAEAGAPSDAGAHD